jgi:Lrp/AsnC family transcriptional regulator
MDYTDVRILEALQQNAKINIKDLADQLNMTKTPIYERIKKLEKDGVIDRYVALVEKKKLGSFITVFCSVSLDMQNAENLHFFDKAIVELPEVVECYLTGGIADYLMKVVVKDLEGYHEFASGKLAKLPHVVQIKSTFVLSEIKYQTALPELILT